MSLVVGDKAVEEMEVAGTLPLQFNVDVDVDIIMPVDRRSRTAPNDDDGKKEENDDGDRSSRRAVALESFAYPDFLNCTPGLNEKIVKLLDELYLCEFRKPWTPGKGICNTADAPYNCNHQMSIHR